MARKASGVNAIDKKVLPIIIAKKYSEGRTQTQIVKWFRDEHRYEISQSEISRHKNAAVAGKYLNEAPTFLKNEVDPDLMREADKYLSHEEMKGNVRKWAGARVQLNIHVEESQAAEFARQAGHWLIQILQRQAKKPAYFGVLWSRTLHYVVAQLEKELQGAHPCQDWPIKYVPLCGEPVYQDNLATVDFSASLLASKLQTVLHGAPPVKEPSLSGVWAYLSRHWERDSLRQHFEKLPGYFEIFKAKDKLVDRLDGILTGVGIIDLEKPLETGTFVHERVEQKDTTLKILDDIIYGDIGGALVRKEPRKGKKKDDIDILNEGLTGVHYEHFQAVAEKSPGVLVIAASHPKKARLLLELARDNAVNEMFIDRNLANEMHCIVKEEIV